MVQRESASRTRLAESRRIVVKVGTNVLTGNTNKLDLAILASLVSQVAKLSTAGHEMFVVSSGAVAAGRNLLHRTGKSVPHRQVLASVGQGQLMAAYDQLFRYYDIVIAQALLTRADLGDRLRYLNARTTLLSLVEYGVVPIINENDVVATEELRELTFGDNDALSALVANCVDADLLVILTDTAGLFTADPAADPAATLIPFVEQVGDEHIAMAGGSLSSRGRGGMATKVRAARFATECGVAVAIVPGREPNVVNRLLAGEAIGTLFAPVETRLESRKRWLLSGIASKGRIVVDSGAAEALRERGKSLLAAGIVEVEGLFERGDTVDVVEGSGRPVAYGVSSYGALDVEKIRGMQSDRIHDRLGYDYGSEIVHRNNLVIL